MSDDKYPNVQEPTKSVLKMMDAVREDFYARWDASGGDANPINKRLRDVATFLCKLDGGTADPEAIVMGIPSGDRQTVPTVARHGYGTVAITFPMQPCWATYIRPAQDAIAAVDSAEQPGAPI